MTDKVNNWALRTNALHAGFNPTSEDMEQFRTFVPPLIQSSVYPFQDAMQCARVVQHKEHGYYYGRCNNPTVGILEKRLAALEGGERALSAPSGMHAIFVIASHLTRPGDEIVASHMIYGGAHDLFTRWIPEHMGITTRFVENPGDLKEWERLITPKTRFVYAETPSNPTLFVTDISRLAEVAHANDIPLIVDNTLTTSCLQRPMDLGADIVVLSLTKFICGNGSVLAGAVIGAEDMIEELLSKTLVCIGAVMSPFDAWLTLMSIETLPARMAMHSSNATEVASYLDQHPKVNFVYYPSLPTHPQQELAKKQMPNGFSGMLSFDVSGDMDGAAKVMEAFKIITIGPSFGASRTIAAHSATATHYSMTPEERNAVGITDGLIRLSVGLEDSVDLISDLEQALEKKE